MKRLISKTNASAGLKRRRTCTKSGRPLNAERFRTCCLIVCGTKTDKGQRYKSVKKRLNKRRSHCLTSLTGMKTVVIVRKTPVSIAYSRKSFGGKEKRSRSKMIARKSLPMRATSCRTKETKNPPQRTIQHTKPDISRKDDPPLFV